MPAPPRLARLVARVVLPPRDREYILGDFHEQYVHEALPRLGAKGARRWYWRQVMQSIPAGVGRWSRRGSVTVSRGAEGASAIAGHVRHGWRSLVRNPATSLLAVLTLSLGVGAATAIFSVVDGVVFRPLPIPGSERVMALCETRANAEHCTVSVPNVHDWEQRSETFERFGLGRNWPMSLTGFERDRGVSGGLATAGLFDVLGASPVIGRTFFEDEMTPGGARVVVLSHEFWLTRLAADPDVVGTTLSLDDVPHVVVGVLDSEFAVPELEFVQLWTPLPFAPSDGEQRGWRGFLGYGRLAPGVALVAAREEMRGIAHALAREHPETNEAWGVSVQPLKDAMLGPVKVQLTFFLGAVGLVLLLACVSVANLQIARATARSQEMALRASLGADRARLAGMLLGEGLVVALAGVVIGTALAAVAVPAFLALAPEGIPRVGEVSVNGRALAFALGAGAFTTAVFALAPLTGASPSLLTASTRDADRAPAGARTRAALVVFQVGTAMVLLVGGGLLWRSFAARLAHDPGFAHDRVALAWIYAEGDVDADATVRRFGALAAELAALPGVEVVGRGSSGPYGWSESTTFWVDGRAAPEEGSEPVALVYDVDPRYFEALGIPVILGRTFAASDDRGSVPVVAVNQALARAHFPGRDPVGERLAIGQRSGATAQIVGVVGDVTHDPGQPARPVIYWPQLQQPRLATFLYVRAEEDPTPLLPALRDRLERAGTEVVVANVGTMDAAMASGLVQPRFAMALLGIFSAVALGLASVGVFGLVAFAVSRRTREIGVRISVGARRADVLWRVLAPTLRLLALGATLGLLGAVSLRRFIAAFLVGVEPTDPVALVLAPLVLLGVGLLASGVPALRATRVDPVRALKTE